MCVTSVLSLHIIIAWNLSRLAIMLLFLNQSIADFEFFSSVWQRLAKLLQVAAIVLSSAKSCRSEFYVDQWVALRHEWYCSLLYKQAWNEGKNDLRNVIIAHLWTFHKFWETV